jgi:uncharacterized LabA/DUF88 family protein
MSILKPIGAPMERAALFLDIANLEQAFRRYGTKIDYLGLRDFIAEGRCLVETFAYVPINPYDPERKRNFIDFLKRNGFLVRSKVGKPRPDHKWKCNFDIEMAVDMLHYAQHGRVDIVVMGSGDGDFIPILQAIRMNGVRCEVASTKETMAEDLLGAANGFIDLGKIIVAQSHEPNIDAMPVDDIPLTPGIDPQVDVEG